MIAANDNDIRWVYTYEMVVRQVKDRVSRGQTPDDAEAQVHEMYRVCGYRYVDIDPYSTVTG
jgi:tRNA G26 N,N-dimethylase Trm1